MPKTITIRIDDDFYNTIKKAANSKNRSIANYIENAMRTYLVNENFISDEEMEDILKNKDFIQNIKSSLDDVEKGKYTVVG